MTLKGADAEDTSGVYTDYTVCAGGKMALPVPVREGYTFLGYMDSDGKDVELNAETGFAVVTVGGDVTYTSKGWKANTYTIHYDANGGILSGADNQKCTYGVAQKLNNAPVRTDYVFKGWKDVATGKLYDAGEEASNLTAQDGGEVTLIAVWELQGYEVTYDLNGGSISEDANPTSYIPNSAETVLAYPSKTGYTFDGWYNGSNKVISLPGGNNGALSLKAVWTAKDDIPYVVNHYQQDTVGGGKTLVLSENLTGTAGTKVTPDVQSYGGFETPARKTVEIAGDGQTTVEYVYTRKQYNLTLDLDGGAFGDENTPVTYTLLYGANLELDIPVKEDAIFAGWTLDGSLYTASTMPDSDISLKAVWSDSSAGVIVNHYQQDTEGNYTILAEKEILTGEDGQTVTPDIRSYKGFTSPKEMEVTLTAGQLQTVELKYARNHYKVKWDLDGGEAENSYTDGEVYYGEAITAPILKKQNYSYQWDQQPAGVMDMENLSYKAVWTPDSCKVAFDGNGGTTNDFMEKEVVYGDEYGTLPVASKENAEFTGWYDENGNRIKEDTVVGLGTDHILYAGWEYVTAKITYKGIEKTDTNENPDSYRIGEETVIKVPERDGYTFLGWSVGDSEELTMEYTIPADMTEDLVLTANWEVKTYTLSLYSYSGLYLVKKLECGADLSTLTLPRNSGYTLTGWTVLQTNEVLEKLPDTMPAEDLTVVAQWKENIYRAIFNNLYDAEMEEITWKIDDNSFLIQPPTVGRKGYDFAGWYLKDTCDDDSLVEKMNPVACNVNLYAKWIPRTYKINLYFNQGTDASGKEFNDDEDNEFTYDETKALKTASAMGLTRNGYTFMGWSTKSGGEVAYADGYTFTQGGHSLYNGEAIVNLYAVWKPITYQIVYDSITVGATGNADTNPTQYTVESNDDVTLENPIGIKEGYQFLGWFDVTSGNEVKLENDGKKLTLKEQYETKKLRAKWAYAGTFSIALKSSTSATPTGDGESVFTITRNMATGTSVTDDPQRVYYRTVNGTAVGGTVTVKGNAGPENDKESANNFKHVGGNNTFAMFNGNEKPYVMVDNSKNDDDSTINENGSIAQVEFKVTKERASIRYYGDGTPGETNGTFAHQFNYTGTNTRYYTAELYRIESVKGNVTGVYGTKEATRTMTMPSDKVIDASVYNDFVSAEVNSGKSRSRLEDWSGSDSDTYAAYSMTENKKKCWDKKFSLPNSYSGANVYDKNDERLNYLKQAVKDSDLRFRYRYEGRCRDDKGPDTFTMRCYLGDKELSQNKLSLSKGSGKTWTWSSWSNYTDNLSWSNLASQIYVGGVAADVDWVFVNYQFALGFNDTAAPDQVGIAPAATTDYQKGDTVRFSVIYDEVIASASNVTVDASKFSSYMPLTDVKWTGKGVGTNVLVFEGTATKNFSNTTWKGSGTNKKLMDVKPVNGGTVKDMKGN